MKAAWFNKFGIARDVLEMGEWKEPEPQEGEVKIRVYASGVNPSDTKKRAGANPILLDAGAVIPNSDGAGVIKSVGSGVSSSRIGQRVWIYNGQYGQQEGTSAEYVCVPSTQAVNLPDNASFEVGAMMGIPAMTAHRCVMADGEVKDKIILVTGGAGRVGYYAIQWAKHFGAKVIATGGGKKSVEQCYEAGADLVVSHPSDDATKQILEFTKGQKIDRVIDGDFGANLAHVLDVIKVNGVIATYSSMTDMNPSIPFVRMMFLDLTIRMVLVYEIPMEAKLHAAKDIIELLESNGLKNRVANIFPLDEIASAHEAIEAGSNYGSVILKVQ